MATRIPTGVEQKFWGKVEAADAFDTVVAMGTADALPLLELTITPTKDYIKSRERVGSASLQNEVASSEGGTWSAKAYVKPNGTTVTTAPDIGQLLKAAFGYEDTSGDVSYACHTSGTEKHEPQSLQLVRTAGPHAYEVISGCWVEQVDIEITRDIPTISFSGGFASLGFAYGGTINGALSSSATSVVVDAAHGARFRAGSYIAFRDSGSIKDGAGVPGAGYKITAVNNTTHTLTITPGIDSGDATVGDDSTIEAFVAPQTLTTNSPVSGVDSGISIGGNSVGFISFKVSYKTGIKGLDQESSTAKVTRLVLGDREVTGEIEAYAIGSADNTLDVMHYFGDVYDGNTVALIGRAGANTTKARMMINVPAARIDVTPLNIPEAEEATVSMSFTARKSSSNGDELSLDFS